jgi:hypothetical protein
MATFSASAFRNAAPGLGALAQAIGGKGAYEGARNAEIGLQSKLAQALAQQQADEAAARVNTAKASGLETRNALSTPEALRRDAMASNGIPLDEEGAVTNFFQSGNLGGKYQAPVDGVGPVAPAPEWSKNLGDVARAISGVQTALAIGDKSSENIAKAGAINRESRLSDAIIAGTANRNAVGGAQAAVAGKDLYNRDATGSVLDQFTGGLDTSNPLATSTINLRKEQAGAQKANASQSYASADNSRAQAEQRRAVTAAGGGTGKGGKVPIGYQWAVSPDGENILQPIKGGPKDPNAQTGKPLPAAAAKGFLDNQTNLLRAQKALALVEGKTFDGIKGDKSATGAKGVLPMQVLNRVDPEGTETRAALADLGSLVIHDRSGAAVTAAEFPRLAPFIPTVYDDAKTSAKKLRLFEQNYRAIVEDAEEFYKASGYNVPKMRPRTTGPAAATQKPAATTEGWGIEKVLE